MRVCQAFFEILYCLPMRKVKNRSANYTLSAERFLNLMTLPVKRTMKNYKFFPGWQLRLPAAFLRREILLVLLHRREDAEIALHAARVVIVDVAFDHASQLLFAREALAIVPLTL